MENNTLLLDAKTRELVLSYIPEEDKLSALSDFFSGLSDGTRLKILSALSISPMCVGDISAVLKINQTTISHQLKNLKNIGAVKCKRQGKISFYSIRDKQILDVMLAAVGCIP